jgi:hypothetical protein
VVGGILGDIKIDDLSVRYLEGRDAAFPGWGTHNETCIAIMMLALP